MAKNVWEMHCTKGLLDAMVLGFYKIYNTSSFCFRAPKSARASSLSITTRSYFAEPRGLSCCDNFV